MTKAQKIANRLRWGLLAGGLVCWLVAAWWVVFPDDDANRWGLIGTPLMWAGVVADGLGVPKPWSMYIDGPVLLGWLLILQWFFLRPRGGWAIHLAKVGRPMTTSIVAAGFMAMLLTTGGAAIAFEIIDRWDNFAFSKYRAGMVWVAMLMVWFVWGVVFYIYWRGGDRYSQLAKMVRGLVAGSVLELLIAAPIQAFYHNRSNCYCFRGTYTGLIFGGTVVLWAFGPGVVLLLMREKYRRQRLLAPPVCSVCGYDLRGSVAGESKTCPECGAGFESFFR